MVAPYIIIPTASAVKKPFGIESIASEIIEGDGRWQTGLVFQEPLCGPAEPYSNCFSYDPDESPEESPVDGAKTFIQGIPAVRNGAFALYAGALCTPVGGFWNEAMARSREGLLTGRERALETEMAFGTAAGGQFLTSADTTDVTPTPGTPVTISQGIALLEQWLGENAAGRGAILGSRRDILLAGAARSVVHPTYDQKVLFTALATPVAALSGYDGSVGPGGTIEASGEAWLYAIGSQPRIWRGSIFDIPRDQSVSTDFNNQYALTEQMTAYAWQCGTAAVLITSV